MMVDLNLDVLTFDIDLEKANILSIVDFFGLLYIISFFILMCFVKLKSNISP